MSDNHEPSMGPIMAFFRNISIIEQLSRARLERALPDDMQPSHFGVLSHLSNTQKKESPAELAATFQVARPSMTNTLNKLLKKDYIVIESDPKDGRGKLVSITEKGRTAFIAAISAVAPLYENTINTLGIDTFESLLPGLNKIRTFMDENR